MALATVLALALAQASFRLQRQRNRPLATRKRRSAPPQAALATGQASVVRVQALARRRLTQLELEALVRVQAVWRRRLQRDHVVKVEMAALRIQAWFRRALGRWEATDRSLDDDLPAWLAERIEAVTTYQGEKN